MLSVIESCELLSEGFMRNLGNNLRAVGQTAKNIAPMASMLVPMAMMMGGTLMTQGSSMQTTSNMVQGDESPGWFTKNILGIDRVINDTGTDQYVYNPKTGQNEVIHPGEPMKEFNAMNNSMRNVPTRRTLFGFDPATGAKIGTGLTLGGTAIMMGNRMNTLSKQTQNIMSQARQQYAQNRQLMRQNQEQMKQLQQFQQNNPNMTAQTQQKPIVR